MSFSGVPVDVGINSPTQRYFEHHLQAYHINRGSGEPLLLDIFVDPPSANGVNQAGLVNYQIRDSAGNILAMDSRPVGQFFGQVSVTLFPASAAETLLLLVNSPTFPIPGSSTGHFRLDKVTGADRGIYLAGCPKLFAVDDFAETQEDTPVSVSVLSNDALFASVDGWTQGTNGAVASLDGKILQYTPAPNFAGTDSFTYTITDGFFGGAYTGITATVTITVTPVNDPPTANAGADQTLNEGTSSSLAGSGNDPDGDTLAFTWTQVSGPTITLSNPNIANPTFTAPSVISDQTAVFQLTVSDGNGGSATGTVSITIKNIPTGGTTTRTQGFWSTHFNFAQSTWLAMSPADRLIGTKNMGNGPSTSDVAEMMGGLWSNIAKKSDNSNRSSLDQARMQLAQQLLAAMLNRQAFNTDDNGTIAAGKAAFSGTDINAINNAKNALEAYTLSGDTQPLPSGVNAGSASPQIGKNAANRAFWNILP